MLTLQMLGPPTFNDIMALVSFPGRHDLRKTPNDQGQHRVRFSGYPVCSVGRERN
jgi:hypothetical protein